MNGGNWWAIVSGITIGLAFVFYSYNLQKVKKGNLLGIVALINIISANILWNSFYYLDTALHHQVLMK